MYQQIKYLGLALIMLLGLYPIIELTRVIVISGEAYFPEMKGQFAAEIAIMWTLYLSIIPVFLFVHSRIMRHYSPKTEESSEHAGMKEPSIRTEDGRGEYIRVQYTGKYDHLGIVDKE